jgi:hypothetical protein
MIERVRASVPFLFYHFIKIMIAKDVGIGDNYESSQ